MSGGSEWANVPPLWSGGGAPAPRPALGPLPVERWGGPRPGELAPRAVLGLGRRWVLGLRGAW